VREPAGRATAILKIVFSSHELPAELDDRARFALWRNLDAPPMATLLINPETGEGLAKEDRACFAVNVPLDRLLDLVADAQNLVASHPEPRSAVVRHLRRYLEIVSGSHDVEDDPALIEHVGTTVLDLIALTLGARRDAAQTAHMRGLRAARVQEIIAGIRAGFADPAFSPRTIASKLGLTPRYVQELLNESGTSFTDRVLELRLQKARAMLANARHDRLKVSEIAYACGFNDISYFNRCFRRRYGASPSEVRGAARDRP
jgi:AraC-like DNA-binding protein